MLNKSLTLTANQYKAAVMLHAVAGDLLAHAAPTDETPLQITVAEALEIAGKRIASAALGN